MELKLKVINFSASSHPLPPAILHQAPS
jgi:hypothetical protein